MELCCATAANPTGLSTPPPHRLRPRNPTASPLHSVAQASFRGRRNPYDSLSNPGGRFFGLRLAASTSEDAASRASITTKEDSVPSVGDTGAKQYAWKEDAPLQTHLASTNDNFGTPLGEKEGTLKEEGKASDKTPSVIEYEETARQSDQNEALQFLSNLDTTLDSEDAYSILLYGSGALVALWVSSAIVGALDSVPLIPKVMEIIGLGYTVWFSYRYLIFKKNRDELFEKFEGLKEQIFGPSD